jgi:DNA-binding PadR family transcriptional regulator
LVKSESSDTGQRPTQNKHQNKIIDPNTQKIWDSIAKNYEMIQGAQISNSFILLMLLNETNEPLNSTQLSEIIAKRTKGQLFKISAALKDSLEHRLKREGYVEGIDVPTQQGSRKPVKRSLYSITPKGKRLLQGWISFLSAYSS